MTAPTAYTKASGKVMDYSGLALRADQIQDQNGNVVDLTPGAAIASLTDNSGGSANDTLTALGGLTTLTDSTGLSGTHDDTLAATTLPTTLTDSTGLSGSHDDTLDAVTVPADATGGEDPTEAEFNALLAVARVMAQNQSDVAQKVIEHNTLIGVITQNQSDVAQKVIEHNTLMGVMTQNQSDVAQKVIELCADMEDAKNNTADLAAKINAILTALRDTGIIAT